MYCPSCGTALSQKMKYCNRCGTQLVATGEADEIAPADKRLDQYLDGLFWITVFGLALILGGMALIKEVLHLNDGVVIGYAIFSSMVFLINFGLSLREVFRINRNRREIKGPLQTAQLDTNELGPATERVTLEAAPSVTENTTSRLEPVSKDRI
jgi:zinc-ribbon domain